MSVYQHLLDAMGDQVAEAIAKALPELGTDWAQSNVTQRNQLVTDGRKTLRDNTYQYTVGGRQMERDGQARTFNPACRVRDPGGPHCFAKVRGEVRPMARAELY